MEEENVQAQDVEVQEETSEESVDTFEESQDEPEEETVTLKKSEYSKMKRQATAYVATKNKPKETAALSEPKTESDPEAIFSIVSVVKDLESDEIDSLKSEAESLGVPLTKYIKSESGKNLLSKIRKDKKSKDASESVTSKSPVYKKHTMDDLSKMSSVELEKILPKS